MHLKQIAGTSDLTAFLRSHDPIELERLRKKFPDKECAGLFSKVEELASLTPLLSARLELTISTLQSLIAEWSRISPNWLHRIVRATKWMVIGEIIATIGTASSLSLLFTSQSDAWVTKATVSIGLIGSLIAIAARYLRRDAFGQNDGGIEKFTWLSAKAATAAAICRELRSYSIAQDFGDSPEKIEKLIADSNVLIAEIEPSLVIAMSIR